MQNGLVINAKTPITAGDSITLQIRKAFPITINEQGISTTFYSSAPTLIEALLEQGYALTKADQPSLPWDTPITGALTIDLLRARDIVISTKISRSKSALPVRPSVKPWLKPGIRCKTWITASLVKMNYYPLTAVFALCG